ncbi:hypothetical protein CMO92_00490 [Candidatus Woesearchaeota archaeon]|nr:hypothetical protein [Candidatus Woesearchaeota archaeon]|tara:strand:- start:204 stop:461 length:258 start_codon:yes stop_codon:yes gene_type:complete
MVPSSKKGVEIGMNFLIIAVIGILVLVVIIYLVSGGASNFNEGTKCPSKGGKCVPSGDCKDKGIEGEDICGKNSKDVCCPLLSTT